MITLSVRYPTAVSLPSRFGFEKVAMSTVGAFAELLGLAPDRIDDLKSAVAEACINAIEHGNHEQEDTPFELQLAASDRHLEVRVLDKGNSKGPPPVGPPDILRKLSGAEPPRGMGLFLIQSLVDHAEWVQSPDGGGCIRIVMNLDTNVE
jgi:serine/threonine-protein kinase RsbW